MTQSYALTFCLPHSLEYPLQGMLLLQMLKGQWQPLVFRHRTAGFSLWVGLTVTPDWYSVRISAGTIHPIHIS
jgi:hypothetical protein